jgi:hypothetical protein
MPDRSKAMNQTKRNTLALQVGGWAWGCLTPKDSIVSKARKAAAAVAVTAS